MPDSYEYEVFPMTPTNKNRNSSQLVILKPYGYDTKLMPFINANINAKYYQETKITEQFNPQLLVMNSYRLPFLSCGVVLTSLAAWLTYRYWPHKIIENDISDNTDTSDKDREGEPISPLETI
jgi:hypothetical protein